MLMRTPRRRRRVSTRRAGQALVFAAPALVLYGLFVVTPAIMSLAQSFTNKDPFNPPTRWIGFTNYVDLWQDDRFQHALKNTLVLAVIVVIVPNVVGLAIAVLLDHRGWLYRALRSVFFVPVVLSSVVVSVIWEAILQDGGMLDVLLGHLGVHDPPGWLSDPDLALYTISSIIAWQVLGLCVVIYLAGLQTVPQELYEAAAIDGAGGWLRFRTITWPLLAPATTVNTVMLLITAFKTYDQIQVITNGGPGTDTTTTLAFNVITTAFTANKVGYSAATAVVMLLLVAAISAVTLGLLRRREHAL